MEVSTNGKFQIENNTICTSVHREQQFSTTLIIFFASIITLSVLSILLNSYILLDILQNRRITSLNCMIGNLAFVCCIAAVFGAIYLCGLDKLLKKLWICSFFSFCRNTVSNLISLSVLAISYERVKSMASSSVGELLVSRVICGVWLTSFVGAVPSLFATGMITNKCGDSICIKTNPLDNLAVGVIYESARSILFHVGVSCYMVFELYKFRAKFKYFFQLSKYQSTRIKKKIARIRFVYINSIAFIIFWVPYGIGSSIYKNVTLQQRTHDFLEKPNTDWKQGERTPLMYTMTFMFYAYILLLPLIVFSTNDAFTTCCTTPSLLLLDKEVEGNTVNGDPTNTVTNGGNGDTTVGHTLKQIDSLPHLYASDAQRESESCQRESKKGRQEETGMEMHTLRIIDRHDGEKKGSKTRTLID